MHNSYYYKNVMNVINFFLPVSTTAAAAEAVADRLAAGFDHNHHLAQQEEKKLYSNFVSPVTHDTVVLKVLTTTGCEPIREQNSKPL